MSHNSSTKIRLIMLAMSQPDDWARGIVNRNYYLAREFAANPAYDLIIVWYLPWNLISTLQAIKRYIRQLFTTQKNKSLYSFQVFKSLSFPGHWLFPELTKFWLKRLILPNQTLIFSQHPLVNLAENLDCPVIYDLVDDLAQHPAYLNISESLQQHYKYLNNLSQVKLVTAVNQSILDRYRLEGLVVPNGYDQNWKNFLLEPKSDISSPITQHLIQQPVIVYVGTIQDRFDFDLMTKVLEAFPDIKFILAGPIWPKVKIKVNNLIKHFSNVSFPGRIAPAQKWQLLSAADIAIIPHVKPTERDFLSSTDSMKLYEYLAVGLPVIARPEGGTARLASVITLALDEEAWIVAIKQKLNELSNTVVRQKNRELAQAAVADQTWDNRAKVFEAKFKALISISSANSNSV